MISIDKDGDSHVNAEHIPLIVGEDSDAVSEHGSAVEGWHAVEQDPIAFAQA